MNFNSQLLNKKGKSKIENRYVCKLEGKRDHSIILIKIKFRLSYYRK